MVSTCTQYHSMRKEEHIQELTDISSSFVSNINAKSTGLLEKSNEFTTKYDKVYSELQQRKSFTFYLLNGIIQLEHSCYELSLQQKIDNSSKNPAPFKIHDDVLEASVCKAL